MKNWALPHTLRIAARETSHSKDQLSESHPFEREGLPQLFSEVLFLPKHLLLINDKLSYVSKYISHPAVSKSRIDALRRNCLDE